MLDSIYHMTLKLLLNLISGVKNVIILSLQCTQPCYGRHNVSRKSVNRLGENCIQNFQSRRYIVGYTVGNIVLRRRASGAVKRDFRPKIRRYTSPNANFDYGYPNSNAFLQFRLKLERCKPHKAARHGTKCDVINDVKLFPPVYRRIYCRKFLRHPIRLTKGSALEFSGLSILLHCVITLLDATS